MPNWLVVRGKYLYRRIYNKIRKYRGKFVAIEIETGDYFIGDTVQEAIAKGRGKYPDGKFYVTKIGEDVLGARGAKGKVKDIVSCKFFKTDISTPHATAFLEKDAIRLDLSLIGKCDTWNGEAIVDTGFFGGVAVPVALAAKLGLEHVGAGEIIVADGGTVPVDIFMGKVRIGPVLMDASYIVIGDEIVVGMEILKQFNMKYDAKRQVLELEYVGPPVVRRIKEKEVEEDILKKVVEIFRRLR